MIANSLRRIEGWSIKETPTILGSKPYGLAIARNWR
jgi:hypothetical protein